MVRNFIRWFGGLPRAHSATGIHPSLQLHDRHSESELGPRGAKWRGRAVGPGRCCSTCMLPLASTQTQTPNASGVTSFAAWRRSAVTARARDWASGNPTRSHLCRTSASHVTHQHHTSHISITQHDASCISLQDLIMALRNIGVMRVLRINAKHLQV